MTNSASEAYKSAGVDITAGYDAVKLMQPHIARTKIPGVVSGIGGFGGLFEPDLTGIAKPVLVSGTDSVGTKIMLAFLMDRHDTVGIDCVAMCANDVICCGAKPLFFLDYIGMGKNVPERVAATVAGVAEGCVQAGCAIVGGECAEMPGLYKPDEYDLVGYCTGIVDKDKILDNSTIRAGDAILALPSSGVHSNGFSLVRKIFRVDAEKLSLYIDELGATLGETLLTPTRIYVKPVLALLERVAVKGIAHITGGGFYENIPRSLPKGLSARIDEASLQTPPIFHVLMSTGDVCKRDMFNTFNMGVGMSVVVAPEDADRAVEVLRANGEQAYIMGEVVEGEDGVILA
ncbi:MAG: phosphoribosylformylglycinamidine cyclo-ligase [Oscillospiraceae bacterium]|nr:phosphoribosylformylglycinamidine cyclo-ligase [Oscillospiraceae bacterium]